MPSLLIISLFIFFYFYPCRVPKENERNFQEKKYYTELFRLHWIWMFEWIEFNWISCVERHIQHIQRFLQIPKSASKNPTSNGKLIQRDILSHPEKPSPPKSARCPLYEQVLFCTLFTQKSSRSKVKNDVVKRNFGTIFPSQVVKIHLPKHTS